MEEKTEKCYSFSRRRATQPKKQWVQEERTATYKQISIILQKKEDERTDEDRQILESGSEFVQEVTKRIEKRERVKDRLKEVEDPPGVLIEKCKSLSSAIKDSKYMVVYTGAGISTAARIPDYRGSNGIWTLLQQGKNIGSHDLSQAEPTLTHMALYQLYKEGILKYVVSQNCDGLHIRSGIPKHSISEVHGNMYMEVCRICKPPIEYLRLFDVTEHTARFNHKTWRRCYMCNGPLVDTIVHFGERGSLQWPLNWSSTSEAARQADIILCLGSSLKVLKKYPWLWCMDKPVKKRPSLFIINLQWTPKDDQATLKINGKCDEVMRYVMEQLKISIPVYQREKDPIFSHATLLHPDEIHTTSQPMLKCPGLLYEQPHDKTASSTNELFIKEEPAEMPVINLKSEYIVEIEMDTHDIGAECVIKSENVAMDVDPVSNGCEEKLEVKTINCGAGIKQDSACTKELVIPKELFPFICNEHNYSKAEKSKPGDGTCNKETCGKKNGNMLANKKQSSPGKGSTKKKKSEQEFCATCFDEYGSKRCWFYLKREPVFKNPQGKALCECCDYSDEDEECDSEGPATNAAEPTESGNCSDEQESSTSQDAAKAKAVNPGWFGKGYRKRTRRKRLS